MSFLSSLTQTFFHKATRFYPSNSGSCSHRCFTFITGIQPVLQVAKFFTHSSWLKNDISLSSSFIVLTHCPKAKSFAKVMITLHFRAFSMHPFTIFVHITEFSITLLPHLAHGSTILRSASPFEPLTINLVVRLTFIPLLSIASFHSKTSLLNSQYFHSITPRHLHKKISFITPLVFFMIAFTVIAKSGDSTDP